MNNFTYISTHDALESASKHWKEANVLGVDLECENNLHHYGSYISLIQISTETSHWIVDILSLKEITPLLSILKDGSIQKIFHDVGFDLRIINYQFHIKVKNIFDTSIAAQLLGKKELGLASLLKEYFDIEKKTKFQMADWTKRPLKKEMLDYAIKDTLYLIRLRDRLKEELERKDRLQWVEEEFKELENKEWEYKEGGFWDFRGVQKINDKERAILKELFDLRKKLAQQVNRPVHYIINSKKLMELATDPPRSVDEWFHIKGVHPIVRKKAQIFFDAVKRGREKELAVSKKEKKWYTPIQRQKVEELKTLRDSIAQKLDIDRHLILNKDQMQDIVLTETMNSLRQWQKELIESH